MKKKWNFKMLTLATVLFLLAGFSAIPAHAQTYSVVYSFGTESTDPANPSGSLTQGPDGALYGASQQGGGAVGTVYKLTSSGKIQVLHSFCAEASCADGDQPAGALTLRPDGHFVGATSGGGVLAGGKTGFGTIFDISETGSLTTLYTFTGGTDGISPTPPIYANSAFYGTAYTGGATSGCGTIYRIIGTTFHIMHLFRPTEGCYPTGLVLGTDGNFYGTTQDGGTFNGGIVFRMTPAGVLTVLHNFDYDVDGDEPFGSLIQGSDGNFYGTIEKSFVGTLGSVIYKITPAGAYSVVYQLGGLDGSDGGYIQAGLLQASDGNFYGVASQGGSCDECGTLFQVTPSGSYSVLNDFVYATGDGPTAVPTQHTDGILYGVVPDGGPGTQACSQYSGCGMLYSWNGSLPPFVSAVELMGAVGSPVEILGQGFTSSTTVSFNGTPATPTVQSETFLTATVPAGATTGFITVTTSTGTLTSNRQFIVAP
jgi:uncharacterized repeat protein (TIGR03803 family)